MPEIKKIYEIQNKGKGVISTITPSNLLLVKDEVIIDGTETKLSNGTNTSVSGVGSIADPYKVNVTFPAPADGTETKLEAGTNTTVIGTGSTASPYKVNVTFPPAANGTETKIVAGNNTQVNGTGSIATPYSIDVDFPPLPDGSETKVQAGSNVTVSGNGTAAAPYVVSATTSTVDGSETKVQAGSNVTISGNGTVATPYIVSASSGGVVDQTIIDGSTNSVSGNAVFDGLAVKNPLIAHLEFNNTDKTIWNNGASNRPYNTAFGEEAIKSNLTGNYNASFGNATLYSNTSGSFNTAIGSASLFSNTTGVRNTSVGNGSSNYLTNGADNVAIGDSALLYNISGSKNISIGAISGNKFGTANGQLDNTTNSIFIGYNSRALLNTSVNEIVIGGDTNGNGSNTTTIGNTDITKTVLRGVVETNGSFVKSGGTSTQMLMADGSVKENQDNLQKTITSNYALTSTDNNYEVIIDNGATNITITVPTGLIDRFNCGFIQQGTGLVSFVASGTTINTPIGLKIKGQNYNAYITKVGATNTFQLLGNLIA